MPSCHAHLREVSSEIRGRLGAIALATSLLGRDESDAQELIDLIERNADEIIELTSQLDNLRIADDLSRFN